MRSHVHVFCCELSPYIDNMNTDILVDHDRLHHITFDPPQIVIGIRCLLTLHHLNSLVGDIMFKQRIVIINHERYGSIAVVKM